MAVHVFQCPLRWSDMDAYGHVNNVAFLRYLEEARIDVLLNAAGPAGPAMLADGIVVARHEIDYKRPLLHRVAPVPIHTWVEEVGAASFTMAYRVEDPDQLYVTARTVLVLIDLATGRPRRIEAHDRDWLDRFTL